MELEWVFAAAVALSAAMLLLVVRRTVRMCARTIFAQPSEPTPEEVAASQTHCSLPEAVCILPDGVEREAVEQAAQQAVCSWMQAVNRRNQTCLRDAAEGLKEALISLQDKQAACGERERFEQSKAHQSVICAIDTVHSELTVCVSAQAVHYTASGGQLIRGREDLPEQMLWQLVCTDYTASPLQFQRIEQIK